MFVFVIKMSLDATMGHEPYSQPKQASTIATMTMTPRYSKVSIPDLAMFLKYFCNHFGPAHLLLYLVTKFGSICGAKLQFLCYLYISVYIIS